jgi:rRNA maturation RNase YbeY
MEKIRRTLMAREDFRGREARKIASEDVVSVLAFPEPPSFPHPASSEKMLGEVYLNRDFAAPGSLLGARARASTAERYATLGPLLVHGLLHLLGYRHFTKRDTMKMKKQEKRLWDLISS